MKNISSVQRKIIGISYLDGAAAKTVQSIWAARFMPSDAILIQAEAGDTLEQLLNKIYTSIKAANMQTMTGSTFIFTVFYDLLSADSSREAAMMDSLTLRFSDATMTNVMAQIVQFGYLGIKGNGTKEQLQSNAHGVLNANGHPLCLITTMQLETDIDIEWRAVVVYLDILRRDPSTTAAPIGHRLGYLKYGEHDADQSDELKKEIEKLQSLLGKGGAAEVTNRVCALLQDIETRTMTDPRFQAEAKYQPLHPTTKTPKPKLFGKDKWAEAATISRDAVTQTGEMLKSRIVDEFSITEADAVARMDHILKDANAGFGLVSDTNTMNAVMDVHLIHYSDPMPIIFTDTNCLPAIDEYLVAWRNSGLYKAKADFLEKLQAAVPVLQAKYKNSENDWQNKLNILNQKLSRQTTDEDFLISAAENGKNMKWNFKVTTGNAAADKYILCRNDEDRDMVDAAGSAAGIKTYYIDRENGSLLNMDEYEIKALHAMYYEAEGAECDTMLLQMIV